VLGKRAGNWVLFSADDRERGALERGRGKISSMSFRSNGIGGLEREHMGGGC